MNKLTIYSDGACSGNPGKGGYGAIIIFPDKEIEMSNGFDFTTNNRMELLGIIEPLESLSENCEITIITDSQYVVNAINKKWIKSWINKGWKTSDNKPVKNQDLWNRLIHMMNKHSITIEWVKGHNGNSYNERCDCLAVLSKNSNNLKNDMEKNND